MTLTFDLPQFVLLVTLVQRYVSSKLEVSMAFQFRENRMHGRTDGLGATLKVEGSIIVLVYQWDVIPVRYTLV